MTATARIKDKPASDAKGTTWYRLAAEHAGRAYRVLAARSEDTGTVSVHSVRTLDRLGLPGRESPTHSKSRKAIEAAVTSAVAAYIWEDDDGA